MFSRIPPPSVVAVEKAIQQGSGKQRPAPWRKVSRGEAGLTGTGPILEHAFLRITSAGYPLVRSLWISGLIFLIFARLPCRSFRGMINVHAAELDHVLVAGELPDRISPSWLDDGYTEIFQDRPGQLPHICIILRNKDHGRTVPGSCCVRLAGSSTNRAQPREVQLERRSDLRFAVHVE